MREEMGIDLDNKLTFVSPIYFEDTTGSQWAYLYCAKTQKGINDLQVQEEEVEAVTLMKPNEIVQLAKKDPQAFIPDGLFAFNTFMEKTSANM
mmetsp:Transcript_18415/g.20840  ORF Transcript_18415/g.20840 Transcript_18415/m.20840 type:complete len:93 (+) Transcript_18415:3-281(+)